jgi:hypothetical protein
LGRHGPCDGGIEVKEKVGWPGVPVFSQGIQIFIYVFRSSIGGARIKLPFRTTFLTAS